MYSEDVIIHMNLNTTGKLNIRESKSKQNLCKEILIILAVKRHGFNNKTRYVTNK